MRPSARYPQTGISSSAALLASCCSTGPEKKEKNQKSMQHARDGMPRGSIRLGGRSCSGSPSRRLALPLLQHRSPPALRLTHWTKQLTSGCPSSRISSALCCATAAPRHQTAPLLSWSDDLESTSARAAVWACLNRLPSSKRAQDGRLLHRRSRSPVPHNIINDFIITI